VTRGLPAAARVALALAAPAIGGCGPGAAPVDPPKATTGAPARPALCSRLSAKVAGRVVAPAATELSGLVLSRSQPGVLWTHNDSGDRPRVLAVRADGRLLADVAVSGAAAFDWEDIATSRGALLLADIGDNLAQRESVDVYRVPEPHLGAVAVTATAPATRRTLRYADGPRDAETLLVDPSDGALVIVEKRFAGRAGVYVAAPGSSTLRRRGGLSLGVGEAVTAGDVSADGRTIVLRSYGRAYVWTRHGGERVAAALRRRPCSPPNDLLFEGQGEAIALTRSGRAFYTVPEGVRPAIRRYAPN
jgi:hypothetical protein